MADQNTPTELADEFQGRYRALKGFPKLCERILFVLLPITGAVFILDLPVYFGVLLWKEQYLGFFLGMVLAGIYLSVVPTKKSPASRLAWYDAVLACAGLACGLYIAVFFPSVLYNYGVPLDRLTTYLYLDANGMIGIALDTAATTVLAFVFLGTMLFQAGGAKFFTEFAQCIMGRYRGGPAKISVVASGMFGSISGSAVANVMVDGWITIPMMTKTGYRPHMAAAIEASASTGGIIMPPVMGAAAFLVAEFLGIPYYQVAIAAVIPAILYYLVLFLQVDLEAAKFGLRGLPREQLPSLLHVKHQIVEEG